MKPVFQKVVDPDTGDCFTACLASILEVDHGQVPSFVADLHREGKVYTFYQTVAKWLNERGLNLVTVTTSGLTDWRGLRDLHAIASVPSQAFPDIRHAVVVKWVEIPEHPGCYNCRVVHDPNPANRPYEYEEIIQFSFIVQALPKGCTPPATPSSPSDPHTS